MVQARITSWAGRMFGNLIQRIDHGLALLLVGIISIGGIKGKEMTVFEELKQIKSLSIRKTV